MNKGHLTDDNNTVNNYENGDLTSTKKTLMD